MANLLRQKSEHDASPDLHNFSGCIKCASMVISYAKYVNVLHYTVMHRGSKGDERNLKSLNMIVNFMGWNLTDQVIFVDL